MINPTLANIIVALVTIVWVGSFIASLVIPEYKPDPQINLIFAAIVGSGFVFNFRSNKSGNGAKGTS